MADDLPFEAIKTRALAALERHAKLTLLRRKCTPKQRAFFDALPTYHYQQFATIKRLGFSTHTLWKWQRKEHFAQAYNLIMDAAFEEVGVSNASIVSRLDSIANRCMQASPVLDRSGKPVMVQDAEGNMVAAYTFDSSGANRALETLAKIQKLTVDRHELTGKDGEPLTGGALIVPGVVTEDAWTKAIEAQQGQLEGRERKLATDGTDS